MAIPQGDLALLDTDLAKTLLSSQIYARLAYTAPNGTPRVVPIQFHWTGDEMVFGSTPTAPKVAALRKNTEVAVTVDTEGFPCQVLMLRGPVTVEVQDGVTPEYAAATRRYMGDEAGNEWLTNMDQPGMKMARIALRPTWVGTLDFDTRLPTALGGVIG